MLTVDLAYLQTVRAIAGNIGTSTGTDRLSMFIDEARRIDIQPVITADLLYEIDNDNTSPLTYATLVNGGTYTVGSGASARKHTFAGLKKTLAYFVYARMIKANPVNVTAFGVVNKLDPNSQQANDRQIANMAGDAYKVATAYLDDCMAYICETFPNEQTGTASYNKKFRISAIGD